MKNEKFINQLKEFNLVDDRNLYMINSLKFSPNGESGMALFTVKGNELLISDINAASQIGKTFYIIDLTQIRDFKYSLSRLNGFIRFTTADGEFMTMGAWDTLVNGMLEVLTEENLSSNNKVTFKDNRDRNKQPVYAIVAVVIIVTIRTLIRML